MLWNNFYYKKWPIIQQNNAWLKSSHNTLLMNVFDHLKIFLLVAEGPNLHHTSCTQRLWRNWVQFGPNLGIAIFGRCQRNQERPETAGAGHPGPQKRLRSLWSAEDLKCPNYSRSQRDMLWKSAPYAFKHIFTPKSFQWFGKIMLEKSRPLALFWWTLLSVWKLF